MARRPKDQRQRVQQQVMRRMLNYNIEPMQCPAIIKDDDGVEKVCGCKLFDRKQLYKVGLVPEVLSGVKGGSFHSRAAADVFMCVDCGATYWPNQWKEIIREQQDKKAGPKLIVPGDIEKPEENTVEQEQVEDGREEA